MFGLTLLSLLFVSLALSQEFTCDVEYRTRTMRNGFVVGRIQYSWPRGRIKVNYPRTGSRTQDYSELYQFNSGKGYAGGLAPFLDQWVFRTGSSCACETGSVDSVMPPPNDQLLQSWARSTGYYDSGTTTGGCIEYRETADKADKTIFTTLSYQPSPGAFPCKFSTDLWSWTFKNCQNTDLSAVNFDAPTGCKCGKPLDVVVVLDRSSSIDKIEFQDQKGFLQDFAKKFEYGAINTNLAVVNFKSNFWTTLKLTEGITSNKVMTSVNALDCPASCDDDLFDPARNFRAKCIPTDRTTCCCCCGTSISSGVREAGDQLVNGRPFANKIIITVTDGYHNTLAVQTRDPTKDSGCGPRENCEADLIAAREYAKKVVTDKFGIDKTPIFYAVGVGEDRDISMDEMKLIADGKAERVLRRDDFAQLAQNNLEIIARACDQNEAPCGGCCGFCVCGGCIPVDGCDASSPCRPGVVPTGNTCCETRPKTCEEEQRADPCHVVICDDNPNSQTAGQCRRNSTKDCGVSADPSCFDRLCNATTGACYNAPKGCIARPECTIDNVAVACNDNDQCTTELCVNDACKWIPVNCSDRGFVADACNTVKCDPLQGCIRVPRPPCNDDNNCTVDTCDPVRGCQFTPITCPQDDDLCTTETCDRNYGCISVPIVCNDTVTTNGTNATASNSTACGIGYCEDGVCKVRVLPCVVTNYRDLVAVGAGLGTAAIVGIIIAAILCFGGCAGGGGLAVAAKMGAGPAAPATNNPLYKPSGREVMNPLHRGGGKN